MVNATYDSTLLNEKGASGTLVQSLMHAVAALILLGFLGIPHGTLLPKHHILIVASLLCACIGILGFVPQGQGRPKIMGGLTHLALLLSPLLPIFGSGILQLMLAGVVVVDVALFGVRMHRWAVPILTLFAALFISDLTFFLLHAREFIESVSNAPLRSVFTSMVVLLPSWRPLADLTLVILLVEVLRSHGGVKMQRYSVACGAIAASVITVAQRFFKIDEWIPNQTPFWNSIDRLSGSFTDPNAQGVYLFLACGAGVLPLLITPAGRTHKKIGGRSWLWGLCGILYMVCVGYAGLLSGSRSFVLGFFILTLLLLLRYSRRILLASVGMIIVVIAVITSIEAIYGERALLALLAPVPEGVRRIVLACSIPHLEGTFFSRRVFLDLALSAIQEFSVWGVGPGQFRYFTPALARQGGVPLNGWVDNANNFYLGILAELGIIGSFLLCVTSANRQRTKGVTAIDSAMLVSIALLLVTGPHIEAPEVGVLTAFIVSTATIGRLESSLPVTAEKLLTPWLMMSIIGILSILGGFVQYSRQRGVYGWEKEGGGYHEWLAPLAVVSRACTCGGVAELVLEVPRATSDAPVSVQVVRGSQVLAHEIFSRAGVRKIQVPCTYSMEGVEPSISQVKPVSFTVVTSQGWAPRTEGMNDPRVFGVRVRERMPEDLLHGLLCPISK